MVREQAIAKVMRVTVDKLAEDTEKEESQSPLVQIQLTKKAVSNISHEQNKRELERHVNKLHMAAKAEIGKITTRQEALDKVVEEKLQEVNDKLIALDEKMAERETRLENMLSQLTQQLVQQKKE